MVAEELLVLPHLGSKIGYTAVVDSAQAEMYASMMQIFTSQVKANTEAAGYQG